MKAMWIRSSPKMVAIGGKVEPVAALFDEFARHLAHRPVKGRRHGVARVRAPLQPGGDDPVDRVPDHVDDLHVRIIGGHPRRGLGMKIAARNSRWTPHRRAFRVVRGAKWASYQASPRAKFSSRLK